MAMHRDTGTVTNQMAWSDDLARDYAQAFTGAPDGMVEAASRPSSRLIDGTAGIDQLTSEMHGRLAEVERRHRAELRDMQLRIERLSGQASRARSDVPSELAGAFSRIEQGMAHLAGRIADGAPNHQRRSGRFVFGDSKPESNHFVFSPKSSPRAAPVRLDALGESAPWDAEQADALAHLYESGAAGFGQRTSPLSGPLPGQLSGAALLAHAQPSVAVVAPVAAADDRSWLEERLSSFGDQVVKSIEAARPNAALTTLMDRVDALESRFGTALGTLATKADLDDLRQTDQAKALPETLASLEAQIKDLAREVDGTHKKLARLDAIESHLGDLQAFAQATADSATDAQVFEPAPTAAEIAELAERAIERAIAKLPAPQMPKLVADPQALAAHAETEKRIEAVHGLLNDFAAERRRGEEHTSDMLETVQEALIRLIDRVDAIEATKVQPVAMVAPVKTELAAEAVAPKKTPEPLRAEHSVEPEPTAQPDEPPVRESVDIKDFQRKLRHASIAAAQDRSAFKSDVEPAAVRDTPSARGAGVTAGAGQIGRRSLKVGLFVLGLVGVAYAANLFFGDRFWTPVVRSPAAAPEIPPHMLKRLPPAKASAPSALPNSVPPAASAGPPGMIGTPLRAAPKQQSITEEIEDQMRPRKPSSTPETVNDDVGVLETDDLMQDALPTAAQLALAGQVRPANTTEPVSLKVTPPAPRAVPQPVGQVPVQPVPIQYDRTVAPTISPITTGSNPAVRVNTNAITPPQTSSEPANSDTSAERIDLPPAIVGPLALRQAAVNGDPSAAFEVATRYSEGRGIKQDMPQALIWYQRSAAKGFAIAQYRLGTLYERGLGVTADAARARTWYRKAADQGNVKAMHNLAVLAAGNGNSAPDYATAAKWFREAADRGLADSQFNLGVLNESGLGVTRDVRGAYFWFSLAARGGDAEATKRRDAIMGQLEPTIQQATDDQVRTWRTKMSDPKINDARVAGDQWRHASAQPADPAMMRHTVGLPIPAPQQAAPQAQAQPKAQAASQAPRQIKVYPQ